MRCDYSCESVEHIQHRRTFLNGMALGSVGVAAGLSHGLGGLFRANPAIAAQLKTGRKRILNVFLHGGVSQLESWDPKPNTDTGGPFRAIPTSVPGIHISELLPYTASKCIVCL